MLRRRSPYESFLINKEIKNLRVNYLFVEGLFRSLKPLAIYQSDLEAIIRRYSTRMRTSRISAGASQSTTSCTAGLERHLPKFCVLCQRPWLLGRPRGLSGHGRRQHVQTEAHLHTNNCMKRTSSSALGKHGATGSSMTTASRCITTCPRQIVLTASSQNWRRRSTSAIRVFARLWSQP